MGEFTTIRLPAEADTTAPDGTLVRLLPVLPAGSMAHFELAPGAVSIAVRHRTIEEIWYFLSGEGELWRSQAGAESVEPVGPGVAVTIPLGVAFQFRNAGPTPLTFLAITMPPWPGPDEAEQVKGAWEPTFPLA